MNRLLLPADLTVGRVAPRAPLWRQASSPDVEGRRLAARNEPPNLCDASMVGTSPPGGTPRLYGRRDARHHVAASSGARGATRPTSTGEFAASKRGLVRGILSLLLVCAVLIPCLGWGAATVALQWPGRTNATFAQLDPHGAAGPQGILEVANWTVAYYTKAGVQLWATNQKQFFVPESAGDCKAIYDPASQRFFAIAQSTNSGPNSALFSLVAVSRSSNPVSGGTNDWRFYTFPSSTGIDYPSIGIDAQALYVAYGKSHKFWMAMNKAHLLSGATNATTARIVTNLLAGPRIENFSLQAVSVIGPASPGDVAYCVTRDEGFFSWTTNNVINLYAISNVLGTQTFFSTNIPVPGIPPTVFSNLANNPLIAPQLGTANRLFHGLTVDGNAFWREGELWFSEVVASTNQPERTVLRYYKLKTGGFPNGQATLDEVGDLDGGPNTWRIQAAIGGNARGDVAFVYTQCTSNSFPAMYTSIRRAGQTNFETLVVKTSAAPWTVSGNWADYPVVTPDPEDQTFWVAHLDVLSTSTNVNIHWANITRDDLFYVDKNAVGSEIGTRVLPYHTVRAAHTAASGAKTFVIKPATYPEPVLPLRIDKNVRLENPYPSGTVRIGP